MKIIFSPSKKQNTQILKPLSNTSTPIFQKKASVLMKFLSSLSPDELQKVLSIPKNLVDKNYALYQKIFLKKEKIPALLLFSGSSFQKLSLEKYTKENLEYAQENILILSAVYGVLRPLDVVQPHRLDMNNRLPKLDRGRSLYYFWSKHLDTIFTKDEVILNLASNEYSKMISEKVSVNMLDIDFLVFSNDILKRTSSVVAKQQRGRMLDYCISKNIQRLDALKLYSKDNFVFEPKMSSERKYTFIKKYDNP
jgi:hypothetical protein